METKKLQIDIVCVLFFLDKSIDQIYRYTLPVKQDISL